MSQYAYAPEDEVLVIGPDLTWLHATQDPSVWPLFEEVADDVRLYWLRDGGDFVPPATSAQKAIKVEEIRSAWAFRMAVGVLVNEDVELAEAQDRLAYNDASVRLLADPSLTEATLALTTGEVTLPRERVLYIYGEAAADATAVKIHADSLLAAVAAISDATPPEDAVADLDAIDVAFAPPDYGDWPEQLAVNYPPGTEYPATRNSTFAVLVNKLTAKRLKIEARTIEWRGGTGFGGVTLLMSPAAIAERHFLGEFLARKQDILQPLMDDAFSGTAEIAGNVLTITARTAGSVGLGSLAELSGVIDGTCIIGFGTGNGQVGTYILNHAQTLSSRAMISVNKFFRDYVAGDGVPLWLPNSSGGYNSIDANNYLATISGGSFSTGLSDDVFTYIQDCRYSAFVIWNALTVAFAISNEAASIAAMNAIEPDIEDPDSWPDITIP